AKAKSSWNHYFVDVFAGAYTFVPTENEVVTEPDYVFQWFQMNEEVTEYVFQVRNDDKSFDYKEKQLLASDLGCEVTDPIMGAYCHFTPDQQSWNPPQGENLKWRVHTLIKA